MVMKILVPKKARNFFNQLSDYYILKQDSAP
jgi:hypothetical protein